MIWDAIVGTTVYRISGGSPYWIEEISGIGGPPTRRLSDRGPYQDGDSDQGYRLDPRTINIVLVFACDTAALGDAQRDALLEIFKPLTSVPIKLRGTRDDGAVRQIDCYSIGMLDMPARRGERIGGMQRVGIQLRAANPIWCDPSQVSIVVTGSGASSGMAMPTPMPTALTPGVLSESRLLSYAGSWRAYPVLAITGPLASAIVTNSTTGEVITFGTTIAAGTTLTIDFAYGAKTVVNQAGTNSISYLASSSDLATWAIEAAPIAPGGANTITITGTDATVATTVVLSYFNQYVGI